MLGQPGWSLGSNGETLKSQARFPTEAEAVAAAREQLLKPLAEKRRREHGDTAPGRPANTSANLAGVSPEPRPRDAAATGLGYGRESLRKVREVREAAESAETPEPVREAARDALVEMDRTGNVDGGSISGPRP